MSYFDEMMDNQLDLSKVRDRGSKKWVAMMLPEHVALLRQYNEEIKKIPCPQLDEWDYEALQTSLHNALISRADAKIKLWKEGEILFKRGTIESVDLKRRTIDVQDPFYLLRLNLDEIVDVTIMD